MFNGVKSGTQSARRHISNALRDHPKYFISGFGVLSFTVFYFAACLASGLNASLLINLAASSVIITITTLVVDVILEKHRRLDLQGAAVNGVSKIQMANYGIVTLLGDHHFQDLKVLQQEFLDNLLKKSKKKNSYMDDYAVRLLELDNQKLLDDLSADKIIKLRKELAKSLKVYAEVMDVYAYSFNNKLREKLIRWNEITELLMHSVSDRELSQKGGILRGSQMMSVYLSFFREFRKLSNQL